MMRKYHDHRIMVVDDEEFCLTGLKVILQSIGIDVENKVDFGMSGEEALYLYESARILGLCYSLIITDIQMPGIDGYKLAKTIRQNQME